MDKEVRILLVDPGFFPQHERDGFLTKYVDLDSQIQSNPPMGILAIASFLFEKGFKNIRIIDAEKEKVGPDNLKQILNDFRPDIIGVTLYTYRMYNAHTFIEEVKKWNPDVHISVGGAHTLIYPIETLQLKGVDSIVIGDGETPFLHLCESLKNDDALAEVQGLYFASHFDSYTKFERNTEKDLNALPLFNPQLMDNFINIYKNFMNNKATMTFVSSRGCPYHCNYCIAPSIPYRSMSVNKLVEAVRYYISLGFQEINFYDDTFNANLKKMEKFAQQIIEEKLSFHWSVRGAVVREMSVPFLKLLKKAGLRRMQFGVESGSDKILEVLNKNRTVKETVACFDNLNAARIESVANIMLFCPTEKDEETLQTEKLIHSIRPTYISVQVFVIFPPMKWYYEMLRDGTLSHDVWHEYVVDPIKVKVAPTITTRGIKNADDLFKWRDKIVLGYYMKPRYIFKRLIGLRFDEIKIHVKFGFIFLKKLLNLGTSQGST